MITVVAIIDYLKSMHLSIGPTDDFANRRFRFMLIAKASSNATMYFLANLFS